MAPTAEQQFSCCKSSPAINIAVTMAAKFLSSRLQSSIIYKHTYCLLSEIFIEEFFLLSLMERFHESRRETGGGERDGKFSLSLARSTLCTNMINKKLIICCLCGVLSSSPVRKLSFFHAPSRIFSLTLWLVR